MKKKIALLVLTLLFSLTACAPHNPNDLMANVPASAVDVLPDMDEGASAAADFAVGLMQHSRKPGENTLISPLSVLYALAMTANGAEGGTLAQMEKVLGMDHEELNGFMHAYLDLLRSDKNNKLRLANAIWFKDDPLFQVEQDFLQTNGDYYGAGIYKAPFDDSTKKEINTWVKDQTEGMIPEILGEIPDEAVMYLVNALAFDAQWEDVYEEHQVRGGVFTTEAGTEENVDMMHSEEYAYLEDDLATGFLKYYEGRRCAFAALLPKENVSVQEYMESLTGAHLLEMLSNPEDITVFAAVPKFETGYDLEMSEVLREMGMTDAFDGALADFSRLGTYHSDGVNIRINRVLHKTFLSVAEQGTRAGAATAVEMTAEGAIELPEYKTVSLDRPFVYLLIDCETNLPFFMGTMMDVNGEGEQPSAPGSDGPSKPAATEPPMLTIQDDSGQSMDAGIGTYTWSYDTGDGTMSGVCADSVHPLEWQEFLTPLTTTDHDLELQFEVPPQSFSVRCWSDAHWGDLNAKDESVSLTGNRMELKEGGYIYEVTATWTGENLAAQGTVHYAFYVVRHGVQYAHGHSPAETSQTVDDPAEGYCGNTVTIIRIDGEEYTFMGSDSVTLTDLLIHLPYDPALLCKCLPEISVETEFGTYGVSLSGYARCGDGQADLTEEQLTLIRQIIENQTNKQI